jgi:hypothetical protein
MSLWLAIGIPLAVLAVLSLFRYLQRLRLVAGQGSSQPKSVPEKWQIPDELAKASIPRKIRLRAQGWFMLGLGLCFLAFAGVAAASLYPRRAHYETLISQGVETEANVTHKSRGKGYFISYSFIADGRVFSDVALVDGSAYGRIREGQRVPVLYLRSIPSVHALKAEQPPPTFLVSSMFVLFSAGPGLLFIWSVWQVCRLLSKGHIAGAVVIGSRPARRNGLTLNYRFVDKAGCEHAGDSTFAGKVAPQIGATVTIIYDPHDPRRNTLYPSDGTSAHVVGIMG